MKILREGAAELQLKPCYQAYLAEHPVQKVPRWLRKLAVANLIFIFSLSSKLSGRRGLSKLQSWILLRVYAASNAAAWKRAISNALMAAVLLPGAIVGGILTVVNKVRKKPVSPFLARFMTLLKEEEDSTTKVEETAKVDATTTEVKATA
jgi:hypothetical protein